MRKLKREAKEEETKREERAARARFGHDYRPSHVAQEQVGAALRMRRQLTWLIVDVSWQLLAQQDRAHRGRPSVLAVRCTAWTAYALVQWYSIRGQVD